MLVSALVTQSADATAADADRNDRFASVIGRGFTSFRSGAPVSYRMAIPYLRGRCDDEVT